MNTRKLSWRFGAMLCGAVMLTACEGENLFDNSSNPFIEPDVAIVAPDVALAGDTVIVSVGATAALNVQKIVVSMRGTVSRDTTIVTAPTRSATGSVKVALPFVISSDQLIITAQSSDVSGRLSRLRQDTIQVVGPSGPITQPTVTGIIAPDTTRVGRVVDVRAQATATLPINQIQFRFRGAANQTITVTVPNQTNAVADAQIAIPDGTDNILTVTVVARDVNGQFSLLTPQAEKTITVFPKLTSP
jgi:hypothetical protein